MFAFHKYAHPEHTSNILDWTKWRLCYKGGREFIENYLNRFSKREGDEDFRLRRDGTYSPRHAGAAVDKVKNSIYQRMVDIARRVNSPSYMAAVNGQSGGVDNNNATMNYFIGYKVLPELLSMGKVGVFVDMPRLQGETLYSAKDKHPYLYYYNREQIVNWICNPQGELTSVLLQDVGYKFDDKFGFPIKNEVVYRYLVKVQDGVLLTFVNENMEATSEPLLLKLPKIPFVVLELPQSLMADIADYQIALLNIESSDVNYIMRSNYPFYVEQFDVTMEAMLANLNRAVDTNTTADGTAAVANTAVSNQMAVGESKGRRIPKGLEYPKFINPSSEPIMASMAKQEAIKADILSLLNLSLANIKRTRSSADSKELDKSDEECGLSCIGLELESAERQIATIWQSYEDIREEVYIKYPDTYELKPYTSTLDEADRLVGMTENVQSHTGKKELLKLATSTVLRSKVTPEVLQTVLHEIDACKAPVVGTSNIVECVENGLCTRELGSLLAGFPIGEAEKAKVEHAERLSLIAISQSKGLGNAAARGIPDLAATKTDAKEEKKGKPGRGEAK